MLIDAVDKEGYALQDLLSFPHTNVIGSTITNAHGTGHKNQSFPNRVVSFDIITSEGILKTLRLNETPLFKNHIINFGGLGVITSMTMRLEPAFMIQMSIFENLEWDTIFSKENFETAMKSYDNISMYH